jgi:Zn finger protein HypA/HybF involved in hydrogenase expression
MKIKIKIEKLKCERCNYIWTPRKEEVRICPHCKSPYWDVPRKEKKVKK